MTRDEQTDWLLEAALAAESAVVKDVYLRRMAEVRSGNATLFGAKRDDDGETYLCREATTSQAGAA